MRQLERSRKAYVNSLKRGSACGFDCVLDFTSLHVHRYESAPPDAFDFSVVKMLCSGSASGWPALREVLRKRDGLLMVGSLFQDEHHVWPLLLSQAASQTGPVTGRHRLSSTSRHVARIAAYAQRAVALGRDNRLGMELPFLPLALPWNARHFPASLSAALGSGTSDSGYSCLYLREQDSRSGDTLSSGLQEAVRRLDGRGMNTRRVYISSNARTSAACAALQANPQFAHARCYSRTDAERGSAAARALNHTFSEEVGATLLDVYMCSHATGSARCVSYHQPATLWNFILASHERRREGSAGAAIIAPFKRACTGQSHFGSG